MSGRRITRRRASPAHWLALWAVLFGVYAATLHTEAVPGARYAGDEPHHLLAAASLAADHDIDLANQYAQGTGAELSPGRPVEPRGVPGLDRLHEPYDVGFPLLIAPAYALGGPTLVELMLAAVAALAFVLAAALARRLVPEPWASGGVLLAGLSPPALAASTAVSPELTAGALLAGAALLALAAREDPRQRSAYGSAVLLAAVPWLGAEYLVPALPIAVVLVRSLLAARRKLVALVSAEAIFASLVMLVTLNDRLFGAPAPAAASGSLTGAHSAVDYLERLPRIVGLWVDRDAGLLRWAPLLALVFLAGWLLLRSVRSHLARAIPAREDAEVAAGLLLAVCAAQLVMAVFLTPALTGEWFPVRHLVPVLPCAAALAAWGLRHAPRLGLALGALGLAASAWLLAGLWTGSVDGWAEPGRAPWGPLVAVFPRFGSDSAWDEIVAGVLAAVLLAALARQWRLSRSTRREAGAGPVRAGRSSF
jgi:hypothetical protein